MNVNENDNKNELRYDLTEMNQNSNKKFVLFLFLINNGTYLKIKNKNLIECSMFIPIQHSNHASFID